MLLRLCGVRRTGVAQSGTAQITVPGLLCLSQESVQAALLLLTIFLSCLALLSALDCAAMLHTSCFALFIAAEQAFY
jgi:hypothetical protein